MDGGRPVWCLRSRCWRSDLQLLEAQTKASAKHINLHTIRETLHDTHTNFMLGLVDIKRFLDEFLRTKW
jgi:hypothetical protein